MSCMTMIALCCIGINEKGAHLRLCIREEWGSTNQLKRGVGDWWCHRADVMGIFHLWSRWQGTYQRMSHITRVIVLLSSSLHLHPWVLYFHMLYLLSLLCVPSSSAIVWRKLLYQHRSADQMLAAFFYLLSKKKKRWNRLLMEVEQSAWGTADSCQQHLCVLKGVSRFFGYLHIYCPEVPQDMTV